MNVDEISMRMVSSNAVPVRGEQGELLESLSRIYEEAGVLRDGRLQALHIACPSNEQCWSRISPERKPTGVGRFDPSSAKGCIVLPWVGPNYRRGGVAVLGMNLRYGGGEWEFGSEHRIALDPNGGQEPSLRAGRRAHNSYWSTATMRDVTAALRSQRGETDLESPTPAELADSLLTSARIQAVKCSPIGGRSSPEPEMNRNCPPRYLEKELGILRPSVLFAYGAPTHAAVKTLGDVSFQESVPNFRRGTVKGKTVSLTVFLLTHPAHGGWHAGHRELIASLQRKGLEGLPQSL